MQLRQHLLAIDGGRRLGRRAGRRVDAAALARRRPIDRLVVAAQLGAQRQHLVDDALLLVPALLEPDQAAALMGQLLVDFGLARADVDADRGFAIDDAGLDLERFDPPPAIFDLGRNRVLADGNAGAGRVEQAHGLVGQLARRNVAVRELHRGFDRLVEQLHPMVLLEHAGHAAQHQHRLQLVGLGDLHDLEAPGQRRVLLDVLLVLGPSGGADGAQGAAGKRRLQQVGGVAGTGRATGADQGVHLVDEQDDRLRAGLDLVDQLAQALLELALHRGAGLQQAEVQREQRHALQLRRHVAAREALSEALDHRGLADPGLAGEDRIVLAAAHQDVDDLADLVVPAGHRVHLALAAPSRSGRPCTS